jgi:SpoVK/Ycf46/Vps4 family AAA+-type ATPase
MDGFVANEGVVVLGATNRSEDLDKALLRPGRFDTQVVVPIPDMKGRREILVLYLVGIPWLLYYWNHNWTSEGKFLVRDQPHSKLIFFLIPN